MSYPCQFPKIDISPQIYSSTVPASNRFYWDVSSARVSSTTTTHCFATVPLSDDGSATERCIPTRLAETMEHGWCWQIDFADETSRGYVYSSSFCSGRCSGGGISARRIPSVEDTRVVKFRSGRYDNFGHGNVFAIGNSCGFVEPLEATALHLVIEQIRLLCRLLSESDGFIIPELLSVVNGTLSLALG